MIYISQPLVEDSIINKDKYESFLQELCAMYGKDLLVIKHPRVIRDFEDYKYLSEINDYIEARLVIGHYSSLNISVDHKIPVEFHHFEDKNIVKYCNYNERSRLKAISNKNTLTSFENISKLVDEI